MLVEMNAYMSNYDDQPKEATGKILSMQIPLFLSLFSPREINVR